MYTTAKLKLELAEKEFRKLLEPLLANAGVTYELSAIAAVVIGGTSLAGGRGSIFGTLVGTLIMGILTNLLQLRDVGANEQMMITAVIILLAVWIQKTDKNNL